MSSRVPSPTNAFYLSSNDDELERAVARAARAAASRRISIVRPPPPSYESADLFNKDQIMELFQNCIKLASENKINQKNTWDLTLIDHLSDIIRVEAEEDAETNFQKASCTLEAGVKIYSLRVDSVHSEAYKVLGGINRAGHADDKESTAEGEQTESVQEETRPKKELERKISPLSTLESSFEALNVKKFDVAFTVDPLYHQSSAQFDEGGAKGLLLNNLGIYGGCQVLFDSLEIPGKSISTPQKNDLSELIDISFAREYIEQMMIHMPCKNDISPTLRDIVNRFDEDNQRPSYVLPVEPKVEEPDDAGSCNQADIGDVYDSCEPWGSDHDDQMSVLDDQSTSVNQSFASYHEENGSYVVNEPNADDGFEKVADFMFLGLGFISKQNAWAGPDHWKFRKAKGPEQVPGPEQAPGLASGSVVTSKKPKSKKQTVIDIDFTKSVDKEMLDIFALPKNPKSLLLSANRVSCKTILPEDCHYQAEELVKLFLLPNVMCLGKRRRKCSDEVRQEGHTHEQFALWDNDSDTSCHFDDGNVYSDMEESSTLVSQPRQVNKIEVQYDKFSKQVDVHALKLTLWDCLQNSVQKTEMECGMSFKHVLSSFPVDCAAAASKDISPHLCFICLLHLANEHNLRICDSSTLDELYICFPQHS